MLNSKNIEEAVISLSADLSTRRDAMIEKQNKLCTVGKEMLRLLNAGLEVSNEDLVLYQKEVIDLANEAALLEIESEILRTLLSRQSIVNTFCNSTIH